MRCNCHVPHRATNLDVLSFVLFAAILLLSRTHFKLRENYARLSVELARSRSEAAGSRSEAASTRIALEQLKHRETLKDEFISEVSHELRIPLTSIRGALGLLSSGLLGAVEGRAANLLRIAGSNTDRLVRLVNDILDLQRMESGVAPLPMLSCQVGELILQAVEAMTPMADSAGVELRIDPPSAAEYLAIESNPDRMVQVLCNLLSNAIKFSPSQAAVCLHTAVEEETLVIRVEDRGRGVPADKLETIFERFGQVEPADGRQKGGTGLGLAICRTIITQHGGIIYAQRNDTFVPGRAGATLVIRLPLADTKILHPAGLHHQMA